MKDLVILLLLALIAFLIWNGRQTATYDTAPAPQAPSEPDDAPVAPEVTQKILDQIKTGEIPIETLFIKSLGDGNYSARFMFFNPNGYTGIQYDVTARVTVGGADITGQTVVPPSGDDWNPAYRGKDFTAWNDIQKAYEAQLSAPAS
jgi:hypothetical protein